MLMATDLAEAMPCSPMSLTARSGSVIAIPKVTVAKRSTVREILLLPPRPRLIRFLLLGLGEAAQMMGVEMTTQVDLDEMADTKREQIWSHETLRRRTQRPHRPCHH